MRFFFYGTLRDPDVLGPVIGRNPPMQPAILPGWRAVRRRGRHYPILIEAAGASAEGVTVEGLREAEAARLDKYEGAEYVTAELVVAGAPARVYLPAPGVPHDGEDWTLERWRREHKAAILKLLPERLARL